ncbi:MAG: hypothetical protein ACKO34_03550 [Vampirovibrionales bacterium]
MGYVIILGQAPNTYIGFRATSEEMEANAGELFIETLEGWSQEAPPTPPISPQQKRGQLIALFSELPLATRAAFADVSSKVYTALEIGDVALAVYFVTLAGQNPNADTQLIQMMLDVLNA